MGSLLRAMAELLDAVLPAELKSLELASRLRRIDPDRLADAALYPARDTAPGDRDWRLAVEAIGRSPSPSLDSLGRCLDLCVAALESMPEQGEDDEG